MRRHHGEEQTDLGVHAHAARCARYWPFHRKYAAKRGAWVWRAVPALTHLVYFWGAADRLIGGVCVFPWGA